MRIVVWLVGSEIEPEDPTSAGHGNAVQIDWQYFANAKEILAAMRLPGTMPPDAILVAEIYQWEFATSVGTSNKDQPWKKIPHLVVASHRDSGIRRKALGAADVLIGPLPYREVAAKVLACIAARQSASGESDGKAG